MSWTQITAHVTPPPLDWSPIIEAFRSFGIENTIETEETLSGCLPNVETTRTVVAALSLRLRTDGVTDVTVSTVEEVDWDQVWRDHFKAQIIPPRIVVRPTWESPIEGVDLIDIVIDPGEAFGTGDHATTKLCLQMLQQVSLDGKRVLDLGCGSGILSIAACRLGATLVVGSDIERCAIDVARKNAELNGVAVEFLLADGAAALLKYPRFDFIVSNIISATLIRLSAEIANLLKPNGSWLASGILEPNEASVVESAAHAAFALRERREENGWVALLFSSQP